MECFFGKKTICSDKKSDEYILVNNFGYTKNIDTAISVNRETGRLDYQIIYIDKGYGYFLIDNKKTKIESGHIIIIYPNEKNLYGFSEDSSADYYWIHFTGAGIPHILKNLRLEGHVFKTGDFFLFKEKIDEMAKACALEDFTTEIFLSSTILSILSITAKKIYVCDSPIQKVIEEMQKENMNTHTNSHYAKMCGISEYHFIRKFKKITGLTPHQYQTKVTVGKAAELLTSTNFNISETSHILGFEDSLYFSRLFKKEMGISPKKYILEHQSSK